MVTMGQGPSSHNASHRNGSRRGLPSRTSIIVNSNGSIINTDPNPLHIDADIVDGSASNNNNVRTPSPLESASYLHQRKSTSSLGRMFLNRKWKKRRGSISASFSINENDIKVELMNINTATEEELMTLPGVNRALARNIVNHRQMIGGFRKVEDLALVSDMGATKLDMIRAEVCVSKRRPGLSLASSKSPSLESISSVAESVPTTVAPSVYPLKRVNVNTANIFDLMTIPGINQALAARIVNYRDKKGTFRSVDDLKRVGISYKRLGAVKMYLTTYEVDSDRSSTVSNFTPGTPASVARLGESSKATSSTSVIKLEEKSRAMCNSGSSTSVKVMIPKPARREYLPSSDLKIIYDLMSVKTPRPEIESEFNFEHNGAPAVRVATWNLEKLTKDKINNPGVMEVITRTILERGISLLTVQEICDVKALEKICSELNNPLLTRNQEWVGYRGTWKWALHNRPMHLSQLDYHLGVLYNTDHFTKVENVDSDSFTPFQNGSLWQFAVFKVESPSSSWMLINVLSTAMEVQFANGYAQDPSKQKDVTEYIKALVDKTEGAMIMGFFNASRAQKGLDNIADLSRLLPQEDEENPYSLWISPRLQEKFAGDSGYVEDGLTHLSIPKGWTWGGQASTYGPLWCTFYSSSNNTDSVQL
ncbi:unnamed protein product [Orchesella dallaii]|uniref:Endonuclease/exonuclease/phosphatase family domain-containing protein 1 n=1 Tax=Orchesella dallaii TaxID=48710 RepID=A0ABP1RTU9_9HEXA